MKWKRLGSSALALVLVCCLIFNMCTIPARALGSIIAGVVSGKAIFDTVAVIAAACIGLGVAADLEQRGVFDEMCNSIKETLGLGDTMEVPVLSINDVARYHVPAEFISSIRDTLWGNQIIYRQVSGNCAVKVGQNLNGYSVTAPCYGFNYGYFNNSKEMCLCSRKSFSVVYPDGTVHAAEYTYDSGISFYMAFLPYQFVSGYPSYSSTDYSYRVVSNFLRGKLEFAVPDTEVVSVPGLITGEVADQDADIQTGYAGWFDDAVVVEDEANGSSVVYVPIGVSPTYEDTVKQTQLQVQVPDAITDTDVGSGSNTGSISGTFADTAVGSFIEALINALWGPIRWLGAPLLDNAELIGKIVRGEISIPDAWQQLLSSVVSNPIVSVIQKIISGEITLPQALSGALSEIISHISTIAGAGIDAIPHTLSDIFSWCVSLPQTLADLFTTVIVEPLLAGLSYLFIPSEGFLADRVDALRAKFGFADGVIGALEVLVAMFNDLDPEPPVIWIDLGASRGSFDIGGKVKFVDMTWYAEYKPTVDQILSAFLWLWFVWRLALSLPGIISGTTGMWGDPNTNVDWPLSPLPSFQDQLPSAGQTSTSTDSVERLRNAPFKRTVTGYKSAGRFTRKNDN